MTYPNSPGFKERGGTSQLAAEAIKPRAKTIANKIINALQDYDLSTDACADIIGASILTVRPRFSELEAAGKIEKTGEYTRNASGRKAVIWRIKK